MKTSNLQCRAVIMCGISGSGKTHYSRRLEEDGYIRLSTDALIWEKIGSKFYDLSIDTKQSLFAQCRKEIIQRFIELIKEGQRVVIDATHCKRIARDEIRNICSGLNIKPIFLYCNGQKDELWYRLSQRKGKGPDELLVTYEEFSRYWNGFEHPQEDEEDVISLF